MIMKIDRLVDIMDNTDVSNSSVSKILLLVITKPLVIIIMIIVSEGSRATVPNWPFGQQPFIIGYWFLLLFAVFFC